jgi:hypothetical protein
MRGAARKWLEAGGLRPEAKKMQKIDVKAPSFLSFPLQASSLQQFLMPLPFASSFKPQAIFAARCPQPPASGL